MTFFPAFSAERGKAFLVALPPPSRISATTLSSFVHVAIGDDHASAASSGPPSASPGPVS